MFIAAHGPPLRRRAVPQTPPIPYRAIALLPRAPPRQAALAATQHQVTRAMPTHTCVAPRPTSPRKRAHAASPALPAAQACPHARRSRTVPPRLAVVAVRGLDRQRALDRPLLPARGVPPGIPPPPDPPAPAPSPREAARLAPAATHALHVARAPA